MRKLRKLVLEGIALGRLASVTSTCKEILASDMDMRKEIVKVIVQFETTTMETISGSINRSKRNLRRLV